MALVTSMLLVMVVEAVGLAVVVAVGGKDGSIGCVWKCRASSVLERVQHQLRPGHKR